MKDRDHRLKIFKQTRNSRDIDWDHFKDLRNMAESNYCHTQIYNNRRNVRSMWKTIRQCLPSKACTRPDYHKDPSLPTEEFNVFFTSVGINTADKVKLANDNGIHLSLPAFALRLYSHGEKFELNAVSMEEIRKIFSSMPSNKARTGQNQYTGVKRLS